MTPRFWRLKVRLQIQIRTDDVVYSGRLSQDSCRGWGLDIHTAMNRQNRLACELVIPVLVNVSFWPNSLVFNRLLNLADTSSTHRSKYLTESACLSRLRSYIHPSHTICRAKKVGALSQSSWDFLVFSTCPTAKWPLDFGMKQFDFRIQIRTDDVVYSGRLHEDSCRGWGLGIHTAINRQNRLACDLVIPVLVNVFSTTWH